MGVIPFKRPEPEPFQHWRCNCGSFEFWLGQDGSIQCAKCDLMHDEMCGHWHVSEVKDG